MRHPFSHLRTLRHLLILLSFLAMVPLASAWELAGVKNISALTRDQQVIALGTVEFKPMANGNSSFTLNMDHSRFTDHFLSMKEFKCLEAPEEVMCHVPYPYKNPAFVSSKDYAWLEHHLLFLFKQPRDFGAKLWNGLYYRFERDEAGLVGIPQAVDLNQISAPPDDLTTPPYGVSQRDDIAEGSRWISRLLIR